MLIAYLNGVSYWIENGEHKMVVELFNTRLTCLWKQKNAALFYVIHGSNKSKFAIKEHVIIVISKL